MCNSRCSTCGIWKKPKKEELTFREIDEFFRKNNYFPWIDITGGEIFMRPDILKIFKSITDNCKNLYSLHFTTNGLMPDRIETSVKQILKMNPNKLIISVSLDGSPEIHDKTRGLPGAWEKAIETFIRLRKIKAKNLETYLGITLSQFNAGQIDSIFESVKRKVKDITYKDLHLNIAHESSHFYGNVMKSFPTKQMISDIKEFTEKKKKYSGRFNKIQLLEKRYLTLGESYMKTKKTPIACQALSASCFIDPYGNIYPCGFFDVKLGNLKDVNYDIKVAWKSEKAKKIRKQIKAKECPNCWTPCEAYQSMLADIPGLFKN
jgi:MoaA/NifB/PqqE/SkfB family radical SAM enzyme